jgi:uncharacterized membrane protein YoaK (UPF0700 family)
MLAWALALEAIFFATAGLGRYLLPKSQSADDPSAFCIAILLLMAMATQNALMRLFLPKLPSTTAMTTNIAEATVRWTRWAEGVPSHASPQERQAFLSGAKRISITVTSFAIGAIVGGLAALKLGSIGLALPIFLLLYLSARSIRPGGGTW